MNNNKILAVLAVIIIVAAGAYAFARSNMSKGPEITTDTATSTNQNGSSTSTADSAAGETSGKSSISWKVASSLGKDEVPFSKVTVIVNGIPYEAGEFTGTCVVIGANGTNGIDGKGLLAGELSGAQCWHAGAGDEIGVFANENGGFDILVGELGEGEPGDALFRGNFKSKHVILP